MSTAELIKNKFGNDIYHAEEFAEELMDRREVDWTNEAATTYFFLDNSILTFKANEYK